MPANHCAPHTEEAKAKMRDSKLGIPALWKRRPTRLVGGIVLYRCGRCREFFPKEGFYSTKKTILAITSECRKCHGQTCQASRDKEKSRASKRLSEAKRRASKFAGGDIPKKVLTLLLGLFGHACLKCGSVQDLQWDHVVPLARGGKHCVTNLQRLCGHCNYTKRTKTADYRTHGQKQWAITFKRV